MANEKVDSNLDAAAKQFVILDLLKDLMAYSENPGEMGSYLTRQIREFLGARFVVLVHYQNAKEGRIQKIVSIQPQRFRKWDRMAALRELLFACRNLTSTQLIHAEDPPSEITRSLNGLDVRAAIVSPLMVGSELVGCLYAIDLLELLREADTTETLATLSPVVALVLRNATFFDSLESIIEERTQELRNSEERFMQVVDCADEWIWEVDREGRYTYASGAVQRLLGYTPEELVGRLHFYDLFASDSRDELRAQAQAVFDQKAQIRNFPNSNRHKDGRIVHLETSGVPILDAEGNLLGYRGADKDITDRRQAELEVERLTILLKESQAIAKVGGWEVDLAANTLYWTEETFRIHETTPTEYTPRLETAFAFYAPESVAIVQAAVRKSLDEGSGYELDLELITAKGHRIWVHTTCQTVLDQGRVVKLVGFVQDISNRKKAEEALRESEARLQEAHKLESLGVLSAGVAHNLNNILSIIMGNASLREQATADPSDREAYLGITKACARGRDVVRSMLHFAQPTLSTIVPIELHTIIKEVRVLLENTTRNAIIISETFAGEPLWINGDPGSINHAILNLCLNSLGAMPDGGTLAFRTAILAENLVEVSIGDNGTGMAPEVLAHVLEPFYTTKEVGQGTGLGLSMTYGVVKAHGGTIDLSSEVGAGTTVTLRFPRIPTPVRVETLDAPAPSLGSMNVFLVDDDEDVRFLMTRMLKQGGVRQVKTFAGGEALLEHLPSGERPDLVILDQNMPGMNGVQTMERIRDLHPELPILISSGQPDIESWEILKRPRVGVISKPFTVEEIRAKLAQFVPGVPPGR